MQEQKQDHLYVNECEIKKHRIIFCQTCGFRHFFPIPSSSELEDYYRKKYYREIKPFPYDRVNEEYVARTLEEVSNNNDYQKIYQQVQLLINTNIRRMLDIGCGNNLLVKFFQNRGWDAFAIEPNQDAVNYLRRFNIQVLNCPVEDIDLTDLCNISFINLQFVLEHIREPYTVLKKLNKIMVPGGIIRVVVPNDFSECQMAYLENYREEPHWVNLPDHINYFTFESLHDLLAKVGFSEVYRTTNFPLEFLLLSGINYYASEERERK